MPFSGRATDSPGIFAGQAEDISWLITNISPSEAILLSALGDPAKPAERVDHEWLEESLAPNAIVNSVALGSLAPGQSANILVENGLGAFIMEGSILEWAGPQGMGEKMRVTTVYGPDTIVVTRGFGGMAANSIGANQTIRVIAEAQPEGRDTTKDISRPRTRLRNYTQIFAKDIILSGTEQAVQHIGVESELDHQVAARTREALRDLEKNVILSVPSGNSIGGANSIRTMRGLLHFLTTNVNSFGTFSDANVDTAAEQAWNNGGTDCDLILAGVSVKKGIDTLNTSRVRVVNAETAYRNKVSEYENTFGQWPVMMNRWMPAARAAFIATSRIKVVPLIGRSFHYQPAAKVGDSLRGTVLGEYTLVVRNEAGMSQFYFPGMTNVITK